MDTTGPRTAPGFEREELMDQVVRTTARAYADEAGISLADGPQPLFQLLELTVLLGAILQGDEDARDFIMAGAKAKAQEFVHRQSPE